MCPGEKALLDLWEKGYTRLFMSSTFATKARELVEKLRTSSPSRYDVALEVVGVKKVEVGCNLELALLDVGDDVDV